MKDKVLDHRGTAPIPLSSVQMLAFYQTEEGLILQKLSSGHEDYAYKKVTGWNYEAGVSYQTHCDAMVTPLNVQVIIHVLGDGCKWDKTHMESYRAMEADAE